MPFDSREYVVHFRLIQPVEKGGGGGGVAVCFGAGGGGGGGGVCADAVPFWPIQSISVGGGGGGGLLSALVRFNQGGGVLSPFVSFNQWGGGGGGGWCCPLLAQSISGGGAYMLTFVIRVPYSPKGGGGGGGPWPPCPHSGDAYDWLCRPCLLGVCSAGALQALPMVIL